MKNYTGLIVWILLLLGVQSSFAQRRMVSSAEVKKHQLQVGLYPALDTLSNGEGRAFNANLLFLAYRTLGQNGWFKTIELQNAFYRPQPTIGGTLRKIQAGLRYQTDYMLLKQYSKVMPFIGLYVHGTYDLIDFDASAQSLFDNSRLDILLRAGVTPSVHYLITERLEVGVGLPIELVQIGYTQEQTDDPAFLLTAQSITEAKANLVLGINRLRVLVGWNL
ncbi:MAG: hypothetical protein AAF399_00415 [Bacteroidota bacterium]